MTRMANARLAGFTYLFYIAVGVPMLVLFSRATSGDGMAAKLASMAQHPGGVRAAAVLGLLGCLCALVLAVTMYAITRDQDRDLAMLGLTCRVAEGVIGAALTPASLGLLSIAMASGATAPDPTAAQAIATFVLEQPGPIGGWFFAVGSTLFSWLLLRGRIGRAFRAVRDSEVAATSSGVPGRPSGICEAHSACAFSLIARVMSVATIPGAITLTVMPRDATSRASAFVSPISPAFDAA